MPTMSEAMAARRAEQKRRDAELIEKYGIVGPNGHGVFIRPNDWYGAPPGVMLYHLNTKAECLVDGLSQPQSITMDQLPRVIEKLQSFLPVPKLVTAEEHLQLVTTHRAQGHNIITGPDKDGIVTMYAADANGTHVAEWRRSKEPADGY